MFYFPDQLSSPYALPIILSIRNLPFDFPVFFFSRLMKVTKILGFTLNTFFLILFTFLFGRVSAVMLSLRYIIIIRFLFMFKYFEEFYCIPSFLLFCIVEQLVFAKFLFFLWGIIGSESKCFTF